jgi:hypothetical protein
MGLLGHRPAGEIDGVNGDPDFFHSRGILDEIWQARPYVWWTTEDPEPATSLFLGLPPPQRAFVSSLVRQSPGYAIVRYEPPMWPELPKIYPELRPMDKVKTQGPQKHWHGDGPEPEGLLPWERLRGTKAKQEHIERDKEEDDHHGINVETLHWHQPRAKYVFVTSPKIDRPYDHDHETSWKTKAASDRPAYRQAHIAKRHKGLEVKGSHTHVLRRKDQREPEIARRIDVHPLAIRQILEDPVAFFGLEGCLKADSILSAGGAVFSVPSVTLWDADELERFVIDYLPDKIVVIVCDADWSENWRVINQARMCQTTLSRLGVPETHVAAPPPRYGRKPTKGVDDYLGAGGRLEDLVVLDYELPPGLHRYVVKHCSRIDQVWRNEDVIQALSVYAGPAGVFSPSLQALARVMGVPKMRVHRAITDLIEFGAVTVDGDLSTRVEWWFGRHEPDWRNQPSIILAPELRSAHKPEQRLGDLVSLATGKEKAHG